MIEVSCATIGADGTVDVTKISNEIASQAATPDQRTHLPTLNVAVLGATGSIGTATAEVIGHLNRIDPESQWRMWAVSGHRNLDVLDRLAGGAGEGGQGLKRMIFSDPTSITPEDAERRFGRWGIDSSELRFGADELIEAARDECVDVVVASIVGRAGLESTIAAVDAGKRVALANKETLVVAGGLVRERLKSSGGQLLPVDSEHSAIWQCSRSRRVRRRS